MKELLSQMKELLAALSAQVTEMEEDLDTARKDLLKSEEVNVKLERDLREVSDGGRVCCPEVECGSLVLPVVSAWGWLREQEQSSGETATGCLPASASRSRGRRGLVQAVRWQWTNIRAALALCCTLGVGCSFLQVLGGLVCSFLKSSFIHSFIDLSIVALHCCVNFCCTAK